MKKLQFIALAILSAFILTGFYGITGEEVCFAQNGNNIIVGQAQKQVAPDMAKVFGYVQTFDRDMENAKSQNYQIFENVIQTLNDFSIEKDCVCTESFSVRPRLNLESEEKEYMAITVFSYCMPIYSLSASVDKLSALGTNIQRVDYFLSNEEALYDEVMQSAYQNASLQATEKLGKEEPKIITILEESLFTTSTVYSGYVEGIEESPLLGQISINAKVIVEFA